MNRGAKIVEKFTTIGEKKALAKLNNFLSEKINDYKDKRDNLDEDFCSGLSENLTYGEISARRM